MGNTACFTGHRPKSLACGQNENHPVCINIKNQLKKMIIGLIERKNVTHFITGMAQGTDMWAAEIVLEVKDAYTFITLEAAIPCSSQTANWDTCSLTRYQRILHFCDKVSVLQNQYTSDCMMKRNRYMVDHSDFVVAVWNGKPSGTGNTIKYASSNGKLIYCIDPTNFSMRAI